LTNRRHAICAGFTNYLCERARCTLLILIAMSGLFLFLESVGQKGDRFFPGISGIVGAAPGFVIRIFKSMACIGINLDLDPFAKLLQSCLKLFH
jgi:hypothetical protein